MNKHDEQTKVVEEVSGKESGQYSFVDRSQIAQMRRKAKEAMHPMVTFRLSEATRPDHEQMLEEAFSIRGAALLAILSTLDSIDATNASGYHGQPYGFCPICGGPGVERERRPNGNDRCANGHVYPSREAMASLKEFDPLKEQKPAGPIPAPAFETLKIESLEKRITELEELLRSACNIAQREGKDVHWGRFINSILLLGLNGVTARTYRVGEGDRAGT